ncbi:MAG: ABC transporter permease [Planctomycetota bacterium]
MNATFAIARREFRAYFDSPIAYVFLIVFIIIAGVLFFLEFFIRGIADLMPLFGFLPIYFLVLVPLITMRLWAEERGTGTEELLLTLPVRIRDAVLGKFLAAWGLLAVALSLTLPIAFTVSWLSASEGSGLEWGPVIGGYGAALFMGGAYLAIGLFVSAFTKHQIVAAVLTTVILMFFWVVGSSAFTNALPAWLEWLKPVGDAMSLGSHFQSAERGLIEFRDILYYTSMMALFLTLNGVVVDARRWR